MSWLDPIKTEIHTNTTLRHYVCDSSQLKKNYFANRIYKLLTLDDFFKLC